MAQTLVDESVADLAARLVAWFSDCPGAAVAFSGGVDSAVVAKAACDALHSKAIAVTADSPSLARIELEQATSLANQIGIHHRVVLTREAEDENYLRNDARRCFHCKTHLYQTLQALEEVAESGWWMISGTNADDLGDYRPGLQAASAFSVRSPLAEQQINKAQVRLLAAYWGLPVHDKPASPCLSSRIAYGLAVTPERLRMVEQAESLLRNLGLVEFRVRLHHDDLARIELPNYQLAMVLQGQTRNDLVRQFKQIGFRFVSLDLEGFSSGSMNRLVNIDLDRPAKPIKP